MSRCRLRTFWEVKNNGKNDYHLVRRIWKNGWINNMSRVYQYSIYDFAEPIYRSDDEISRYSAEVDLENKIMLRKCCNKEPLLLFKSCTERWVKCEVCGKRTKVYKKFYQAMQAWNREINIAEE